MDPKQPITSPSKVEIDRRMAEWAQAMELSNAMLMAGLRRKIGPDGDLHAAYREWSQNNHDRKWREIEEVQERRRLVSKQILRSGDGT
ncbi:MAG: hypothetical protein ACK5OC_19140 [Pirellula sp.]|jgi:hypothetical protein|nr:hypothetical protein [Planctomycetota bacterium]